MKRAKLIAMGPSLALACVSATAVTPLSPGLTPPTVARVSEQLDRARVPAVGRNSVVLAMLSALGSEPRDATIDDDEPYPHLPKVTITSEPRTPDCAFVSGVVRGVAEAGYATVAISGTFCLASPARWASRDFAAARVSTDR